MRIFLYFMFISSVRWYAIVKVYVVNLRRTTIPQTRKLLLHLYYNCVEYYGKRLTTSSINDAVLGCIYTILRKPYECSVYEEDQMKTKAYNLNKKSHNPVTKRHLHSCAGKLYVKTVTVLDLLRDFQFYSVRTFSETVI